MTHLVKILLIIFGIAQIGGLLAIIIGVRRFRK